MRYIAMFLKSDGTKYHRVDEKEFKMGDETVSIKDKTMIIPNGFSLNLKDKSYVFFDIDKSEYIKFDKEHMGIDATILDQLIVKKLIAQILERLKRGTEEINKFAFIWYVIIFFLGLAGGYIVALQFG